jgi:LysR family transcriptional regulator (chromosome initiation inhibitor)
MLDAALLAAVAAVVREGSFERAARSLGVTPSAVSQRVRLLEERLGAVLVQRGQPCTATPAGARICLHAQAVGLLEADLRRDLPAQGARPVEGDPPVLRVAVNADSVATWFLPAMARFAQDGDVRLDVLLDDQDHTAEWLRRGHVLAAVTSSAGPVQGCRSRRLGNLRYVAACSPAFHARWFAGGVTAEAMRRAPGLRFSEKDQLQDRWVRRLFRREVPFAAHGLPSAQAFLEAAVAGVGWGLQPEPMARPLLADGRLVELVPGKVMDVPLAWQAVRLPVPALDRLGAAVAEAAKRALLQS